MNLPVPKLKLLCVLPYIRNSSLDLKALLKALNLERRKEKTCLNCYENTAVTKRIKFEILQI